MVTIIAVVLVRGVVTGALLMVMVMVVVMVMVIVTVVVIVPRTHEGYPRWSSEA